MEQQQTNWTSSNLGILIICLIFLLPFGLVLLAALTMGQNIDLKKSFSDFFDRMKNGPRFSQPDLFGAPKPHFNEAFENHKEQRRADINAEYEKANAQMKAETEAFNEFAAEQKRKADAEMFEQFKKNQPSNS